MKIPIIKTEKALFNLIKTSRKTDKFPSRHYLEGVLIKDGFLYATDAYRILKLDFTSYLELFRINDGVYSVIFTKDEMILEKEDKPFADIERPLGGFKAERIFTHKVSESTSDQLNAHLALYTGYIYNQSFLDSFLAYAKGNTINVQVNVKGVLLLSYEKCELMVMNILPREEIFIEESLCESK